MNKEMIAIDQDSLGVQGLHYSSENGLEYWFKPLVGGDWAFFILNPTKEKKKCNINWQDYNLTDTQVSALSTDFDKKVYTIYDLWMHKNIGKTLMKKKIAHALVIPAHDIVCYRLILNKK
jgi:alpha-galactosidase